MKVAVEIIVSDFGSDVEIYRAVGRPSDYASSGEHGRDHGWVCDNEFEAAQVQSALRKFGLTPTIVPTTGRKANKPMPTGDTIEPIEINLPIVP